MQEEEEHKINPQRKIKPGNRLYVVNQKKTHEKYTITTKVRPDNEFKRKILIEFEGTRKSTLIALHNDKLISNR